MFSNSLFAEGLSFAIMVWLSILLSLQNFAMTCFPYAFPRLKAEEVKAAKREREKKWREEAKKSYSLAKSKTPPAKTAKPAAVRATQAERHSPRATTHKPSAAEPTPSASTRFKPPSTTATIEWGQSACSLPYIKIRASRCCSSNFTFHAFPFL